MAISREPREPHVWEASLSILGLVAAISSGLLIFHSEPHIPILIGALIAALIAFKTGHSWKRIEKGMLDGIANSLQAIIILLVIGILIGVWIQSGVVPTLLYYGLKILHPKFFLPATLLICAVTSLATGTSWGTSGTIGIAMIGIGAGLGFPLPIVAGAVLSGAYFGDKMSPLSDTTNMAPAIVGTDLYTHIKHMAYTTAVSFGLALIIEIALGLYYSGNENASMESVQIILTTIDATFNINILMLLPPIVVLAMAMKKIPAIPGIVMGVITAAVLGMLLQGNSMGELLNAGYGGYHSETGVPSVDALLSKGGLSAMSYTISIIIVAMMFGGIVEETGQLRAIVNKILQKAQSRGSLFLAVVSTAVGANFIVAEQYMAIVISGKMYAQAFRDRGLHPKNLSRAVEDSATVTSCLVPWNSGGAYQSATLGVPTIAYAPFCFFNWLSPLVTAAYGVLNITIADAEEEDAEEPEMVREVSQ